MKLEYLFTKSRQNKIGSRLISWSTGKLHPDIKPCSHIAIKAGSLIIESTLSSGVQITPYKEWIKHHVVVHAFQCLEERSLKEIIDSIFIKSWGKKYDYKGILYFAWRMFLFLIFKKPLCYKNRWQSDSRYFCVEMVENITGIKYNMTSPIQLVFKWKNAKLKQIEVDIYNKNK